MKPIRIPLADQTVIVKAEKLSNSIWFQWEGFIYSFPYKELLVKDSIRKNKKKVYKNRLLSEIPGQVVKVLVSEEQQVTENQVLLVLSSMKMEYTLKAPYKSQVKAVKVQEGDTVAVGQELIKLENK